MALEVLLQKLPFLCLPGEMLERPGEGATPKGVLRKRGGRVASGREGDVPATCPAGRLPTRCQRESGFGGRLLCSSHPPPRVSGHVDAYLTSQSPKLLGSR